MSPPFERKKCNLCYPDSIYTNLHADEVGWSDGVIGCGSFLSFQIDNPPRVRLYHENCFKMITGDRFIEELKLIRIDSNKKPGLAWCRKCLDNINISGNEFCFIYQYGIYFHFHLDCFKVVAGEEFM